jgi:hypothetical protein
MLCRAVLLLGLQDDLCSFFNALMTCSGAQLDSGNAVINCSITRDKGPPYAFIKLRSVQEASNALSFNGIQFRGHTLKVRVALLGGMMRSSAAPPCGQASDQTGWGTMQLCVLGQSGAVCDRWASHGRST